MNHGQWMESHGSRRHRRILILSYACLLICGAAAWACADERPLPRQPVDDEASFASFPIRMYQAYISGVNGHRCPMVPSCSQYAVEAFAKHGYLLGWIMTSDRLLRCGRDETRLSQIRRKNNETYSYDPVENNDFWWYDR